MTYSLLPEEEATNQRILDDLKVCEDHLRPWREQCNDHYRTYRTTSSYRADWKRSTPPDRDTITDEMVRDWGSDLHIPVAYSTIETIVPRAVSNRPRGLVLPDEEEAEESVQNMKHLIERGQDGFRYELMSQDTVKSGCIYGLGAQKGPYWKKIVRDQPHYVRATDAQVAGSAWVVESRQRAVVDDAWGEDIDIFDLFWDPFGYDSFTLDWVAHRTWRKNTYVADQLRSGAWNTPAAMTIRPEDIEGMAIGQQQMDAVWKDRMGVAGHSDFNVKGGILHEVIEYWTAKGDVITILDRKVPVRIERNPFWHGEMPFHFYRPQTAGIKQLHGISEVEPLSDLIHELDVLRSQRRDNAAIVLQQVFAFDEDAIDRDNLKYGAGVGIPVRSDDPRAHLFPINQGDIPHSGYMEEDRLKEDIDRTSGVSDTIAGAEGGGAAQTATGAQLISQAANARIANKSHRYEAETVTPFTNQMIALYQQMIVSRDVRVPTPPGPGEIGSKAWQWITLTPGELQGSMTFQVEGGSLAPRNEAADAQNGANLFDKLRDNPLVDQSLLMEHYLKSQNVKNAPAWIRPQPSVPPQVLDALRRKYGDDVDKIAQLVMGGQQ